MSINGSKGRRSGDCRQILVGNGLLPSLRAHIDRHFNLCFSYLLFFHIDDTDTFFKIIKNVIDDVSLRTQKNPSNLLVLGCQFLFFQ